MKYRGVNLTIVLGLILGLSRSVQLETFYQYINNEEYQSIVLSFQTKNNKSVEYPVLPLFGYKYSVLSKQSST